VAHFDIQPDNIRLRSTGSPTLVDFGNFRRMPPNRQLMGPYGAVAYSPPESFDSFFDAAAADVWALGIVACTALSGKLPYVLEDAADRRGTCEAVPLPLPSPPTEAPSSLPLSLRLIVEIRSGRVIFPKTVLGACDHHEVDCSNPAASIPVGLDSLLRGMLEIDPVRRLTAEQALQHPWWTDIAIS